ncbi:tripartite tricarboxylate transporter TctB family protein [Roseovarius sp.]|uniref:tripartite tricarboxylate transporter TctB family protein n=1 Tax=Roseovarius sp. TaxID=1486281 RepID=UPI003563FFBF
MQRTEKPERLTRGPRNWGALVLAMFIAGVMIFYALSVAEVARRTTDWLLIGPGAVIGATAALWAGIADIRASSAVEKMVAAGRGEAARPVILIALTGLYACTGPWIGFDVGTAIFILLCLLVQGERSWWKLALASIGGAAAMTWVFVDLLMVRLPVLLF